MVAADLQGKITYFNRFAQEMFSVSADDVVGKDMVQMLTPASAHGVMRGVFSKVIEDGEWSGEIFGIRPEGTLFPLEIHLSVTRDDEGKPTGFVGAGRDITERKHVQEKLAMRQQALESIYRLATEPERSFEEVCESIAADVAELLPVLHVKIHRLEGKESMPVASIINGKPAPFPITNLEGHPCEVVTEKGATCMFSRNMASRFGEATCVAGYHTRDSSGPPLKGADGRVLGVLCAMSKEERVFDEEEIRIIELFAHYAGKQLEEHL